MTSRTISTREVSRQTYDYSTFSAINGQHPWQTRVPGSHVLYRARQRRGGKIAWFNFELAKEMGLIDPHHPHSMNSQLEAQLLDSFAIQIINEYDLINGTKIPSHDIKPHHYMATRYLQLQHPGKTGITSGDGRSLWNGTWTANGTTWDVTSCGTGATCLSPATHKFKKFFRTGDPSISYGCGYSDLDDGVTSAIFSEIMHKNGVPTERILCVIEFPGNLSINVRAGKNLLRPSHFFNHLKQGNLPRLKAAVDFFIDRELANGTWKPLAPQENKYKRLLSQISNTFAEMAARFESEYIFCWLAWDGDNILANGGIIDYGSIRQFGLFHHEYKFDDVDRWSTSLTEQRHQARYLVQTFAQIEYFINTGRKLEISRFRRHPEVQRFDKQFNTFRQRMMLEKTGIKSKDVDFLMTKHRKLVGEYQKTFRWWERQTKQKKHYRVADGITKDALYCMRDILRELPTHLLKNGSPMDCKIFMGKITSTYCSKKDAQPTLVRQLWARRFQNSYLKLIDAIAQSSNRKPEAVLKDINQRSVIKNRRDRITGDAICNVGEKLLRIRKQLMRRDLFVLIHQFIHEQVLVPDPDLSSSNKDNAARATLHVHKLTNRTETVLRSLGRVVRDFRHGI